MDFPSRDSKSQHCRKPLFTYDKAGVKRYKRWLTDRKQDKNKGHNIIISVEESGNESSERESTEKRLIWNSGIKSRNESDDDMLTEKPDKAFDSDDRCKVNDGRKTSFKVFTKIEKCSDDDGFDENDDSRKVTSFEMLTKIETSSESLCENSVQNDNDSRMRNHNLNTNESSSFKVEEQEESQNENETEFSTAEPEKPPMLGNDYGEGIMSQNLMEDEYSSDMDSDNEIRRLNFEIKSESFTEQRGHSSIGREGGLDKEVPFTKNHQEVHVEQTNNVGRIDNQSTQIEKTVSIEKPSIVSHICQYSDSKTIKWDYVWNYGGIVSDRPAMNVDKEKTPKTQSRANGVVEIKDEEDVDCYQNESESIQSFCQNDSKSIKTNQKCESNGPSREIENPEIVKEKADKERTVNLSLREDIKSTHDALIKTESDLYNQIKSKNRCKIDSKIHYHDQIDSESHHNNEDESESDFEDEQDTLSMQVESKEELLDHIMLPLFFMLHLMFSELYFFLLGKVPSSSPE